MKFDYDKLYEKCMELFETDKECAKALGVSVKRLYKVFNNEHEFDMPTIAKWCDVLNIPLTDAHKYFFTLVI